MNEIRLFCREFKKKIIPISPKLTFLKIEFGRKC